MTRHPLVTVLISIHNGARTLDRCFESIHRQTFRDFLIVCIDDASTDTTPLIIRRWQTIFGIDRFTIITNMPNLGLTRSLNRGLAVITTHYTARIDCDDWWHHEKLERQVSRLEQSPSIGIIGTAYANVSGTKETKVQPPTTDEELKRNMFRRNPFAHSAVVFRTELVRRQGGYDESIRYGQDYELWLRIAPLARFENLPEMLCFREASSEDSLSYRHQNAQMWQCVRTQFHYLRKYHRPIVEYRFMTDPFLALVTPGWLRRLKRKIL